MEDLEREAERMMRERGDRAPSSETLYANPEMRDRLRASARVDRTWEVGAIPLPSAIDEDAQCRPVVVMVVTRDAVLAMDILMNLSGETEAVASALHDILGEAMRLTGARPRFVDVAHPEVAVELTPLLEGSGIQVEALGGFDRLHEPARSIVEDLSGVDLWPPMSKPESWAAWRLPDTEVAALFRAAANFFRAAPWTTMADSSALEFAPREGSPWAGVVMGFGGEVFGLALYTEPEDLTDLLDDDALEYEGLGALGALE